MGNSSSASSLNSLPFITVVMPVRNESKHIRLALDQILNQDYFAENFEIIVADGVSDDETGLIVQHLATSNPQIKYFLNPGRLPSSGRNIGFKNGKGDIFVVLDGHIHIPDNQYLKNIAVSFEVSGADCLGRPQPLNPPGISPFQTGVAYARSSRIGHSQDSLIFNQSEGFVSPVSNGFAYIKKIFEKIGYVDENFDACEDLEFNYRVEKAGFKCFMSPKLMVKYFPRTNLVELFRQMRRYGQGRYKFINKHKEAFDLNQAIPSIFVGGFFSFLGLGLFNWGLSPNNQNNNAFYAFYLLAVVYGIYLLVIIVETIRISFKNRFLYFFLLPIIFFAIHVGLGWGFLQEFIKSSYRLLVEPTEK